MNLEHQKLKRLYELDRVLSIVSEVKTEWADRKTLVILEIGAGTGWQAKKLAENGHTVKAIDIEDSGYLENRVWPIIDYDGKHIPFGDNYFDDVFSSNVLEHIPHLESFQSEMKRVLKQNGIALHIVPSGSWRFWTNIAHYPFIFIAAMKIIYKRLTPASESRIHDTMGNNTTRASYFSKIELIRKAIFSSRHGETGTFLSEVFYFSKHRWSALFRESGWRIIKISPNRLFYTGYTIFGSKLSIQVRKYMSHILGSSCHIFILAKTKV